MFSTDSETRGEEAKVRVRRHQFRPARDSAADEKEEGNGQDDLSCSYFLILDTSLFRSNCPVLIPGPVWTPLNVGSWKPVASADFISTAGLYMYMVLWRRSC